MRIALLTGEYPPQAGGVGDYTRCLGAALRARGHEVGVVTIRGGRLVILLADAATGAERPVVLPAAGAGLDWSPRCWPAVIYALDLLQPHWLHIQYQTGAYAMAPGVNLLPWRLRGLPGSPRVAVTFHDLLVPYLFPKAGRFRHWVNARLAGDADAVVVTNSSDAEGLRRLAPGPAVSARMIPIGSNIAVAPPPDFERGAWRASLGVASHELLVAYFGLLSASKGADLLVEALAQLSAPWRLLLVGGAATAPQDVAYAEVVRARIEALGLGDRVIATGHLPEPEVSAQLLAADCAALPFRDGASFRRGSLLAALAHGCPVLTTTPVDVETARALAGAALTVPPGEVPPLAAALARLGADPALRAALGETGYTVAARFSWAAIAAEHEDLYG